uniref:2-hydroxyacyl-CoA lyase 2 isoform X2 n=1 Tax=Myxine glutinosa TaxID=7769 RepID=UPI00358F2583
MLALLLLVTVLSSLFILFLWVERQLGLVYQLNHEVDEESNRHGGELVAECLKAHGVDRLFTLVGGHVSPILAACEALNIAVIDVRHEATAVFAADATARLSGTIGVAVVTAGPGVTNTVTALQNARLAESPLVLMGGAAATILKGRGALQDISQMALLRPVCKLCLSVRYVREITPSLRLAISTALEGTPGPVFLELPIDVLYPYSIVRRELSPQASHRPASHPPSLSQRMVNWYLKRHLNNLFAGAWTSRPLGPLPFSLLRASSQELDAAAAILEKARRPLLLLGSQVMLPPTTSVKLREAIEELGFPCYLGGMARGLLGGSNVLHIRHNRRAALRQADAIVLAGAVCDFRLSYGRLLPKSAAIVAVNRDREQLMRNKGIFWRPRIAVQGDPGCFLVELSRRLGGKRSPSDWLDSLHESDSQKDDEIRMKASQSSGLYLNPVRLLLALEDILPPNAILVADGGDFVGTAAYVTRARGPGGWLDPGAFGTLGVGGGFALGAKLCRPEAEVWILYGDGSLGFSLAEFDTFKRHKVAVIALVGNDACWSQIVRDQRQILGTDVACQLRYTAAAR